MRFRLDRPRRVRVDVVQVAPVCRLVGSFAIRGRAGSNALRFDRHFQGRRLLAGTYELRLRSPGTATRRLRVVVSDSARLSPAALATAKQRNVCAAPRVYVEGIETSIFGPPGFLTPGSANGGGASTERVRSEGAVLSAVYEGNNGDGFDFTSSTAGRLTEEVSQSPLGRLLIGLAMLLFVIAAFPRNVVRAPVLGHFVAARRIELAAVGASLFVGVLLVLGLA